MVNRKKDMTLYSMWLTKAEEESLKASLELIDDPLKHKFSIMNIVEIMDNVNKRGDLNKK